MQRYDIDNMGTLHRAKDGIVYLANDVDRLREEARERVARYVMDYWSYTGAPISSAYEHADCILAEVFGCSPEGR